MNGGFLICVTVAYFGFIYISRLVSEHRRNVR